MHWGSDAGISTSRVAVPYYEYVQSIQNIAMSEVFGDGDAVADDREQRSAGRRGRQAAADRPRCSATFTDAVWSDLKEIEADSEEAADDDEDRADDEDRLTTTRTAPAMTRTAPTTTTRTRRN